MLGKLKEMGGAAAAEQVVAKLEPLLSEHLTKLKTLGADVVQDDVRYAQFVVEPAYLAVVSASSGVTKLIPEFKDRFSRLMLRVRDDLVVVDGSNVRLVEDFQARLPTVLKDSFKA